MDAPISTLTNPAESVFDVTGKDFTIAKLLKADGGLDIINFVFILVGLYFFANFVIAGWAFMMSSGDVKKATAAAGNITNAFSGLIVAFTAFLVVRIITTVLGIDKIF